MKGPERDRSALEDMLGYLRRVLRHTGAGPQVMGDELTRHAVLWELAIIGEAANRLSDELCGTHPEVPWRGVINQRNFLVHGYDRLDSDLVWDAIGRLPELERQIEGILQDLGEP